ncbi:dihydrodipicolinate synthase family protein [Tranquillimonas alkanivorans]|uniref:4-hydroxy-tetrahydrodipicolinate synthase n=1 Tax=Tranquillimonas alkanivorans TaxID=441119 RepID=A0A1I5VDC6_9RHOB|nr:dihydrodipicolinate synthase family protein [Tranquillimonas alkanivorans]SFQ05381.1 4-hydroxy-tetrahydrodipicolinate synthase [Tranquillimonas alkanivorans]
MKGIIAAVPTPVDGQGQPIEALFVEHCRWVLDNGCDGLNVLGSTGEANSFDSATRKTVMGWAARTFAPERLMVGTGTPSLAETIALTEYADDLGYRVALVLPPYYYAPVSDAGLVRWYIALHEALGDRAIQIYFYNYPQMTGLKIPVAVIEELHRAAPERFRGIKDSSGDLDYCREIVVAAPDMAVFPSSETSLGDATTSGFAGCISATVNHSASICAETWRTGGTPDLHARIAELRAAIGRQPLIPSVKYLVARRTGERTWANTLPPFIDLAPQERQALDALDRTEPALAG